MPNIDEQRILNGRRSVDTYRRLHLQLHSRPVVGDVPQEHTPLLERLIAGLERQGFGLEDFFSSSELINIQGLGYETWTDIFGQSNNHVDENGNFVFEDGYLIEPKASEAEREVFWEMWH